MARRSSFRASEARFGFTPLALSAIADFEDHWSLTPGVVLQALRFHLLGDAWNLDDFSDSHPSNWDCCCIGNSSISDMYTTYFMLDMLLSECPPAVAKEVRGVILRPFKIAPPQSAPE